MQYLNNELKEFEKRVVITHNCHHIGFDWAEDEDDGVCADEVDAELNSIVHYWHYLMHEHTPNCVYLISVYERVFVSDNIVDIAYFYQQILHQKFSSRADYDVSKEAAVEIVVTSFFQEYGSFEDAYAVALSMQEPNKLCYN